MPCSKTPASPWRLTIADDFGCGESLLPAAFASTPQRHAGASIHIMVTVSPPRGARLLPPAKPKASALTMNPNFGAQSHGLFTRCPRLATFLPACAVVGPPKARFQLVVNLGWVGLATH
jgi:hypothetical protein